MNNNPYKNIEKNSDGLSSPFDKAPRPIRRDDLFVQPVSAKEIKSKKPKRNKQAFKKNIKKALQESEIIRSLLFGLRCAPIGIVAIAMLVNVSLIAALLWTLFLTFLMFALDSRIIAGLALVCLAACPLLLALHRDSAAETIAIYAYYFLVMTVALQIVEYWREPKSKNAIED